jgi:MFS family permease
VNKVRGGAFLVSALTGSALLGGLLFLIFYFQIVLGYSPLLSGLASLPMTAVIMVTVGVLSNVLPKIGVRLPMTVGPILAAAGLFYLSFITVEGNYVLEVLPGLVVLGIGLGAIFVPLQNVALAGVEDHDAGVASAAVTATQQIGGSIGTALFTALYTSAISSYLADNATSPTAQFGALVSGYSAAFVCAAALMLLAAPIAFFLIRPSKEDLLAGGTAVHMG